MGTPIPARQHQHPEPVGGLDHHPIRSGVVDAGFGVFGDPDRRTEIRRRVTAGIRHRDRETINATGGEKVTADEDVLLDRGIGSRDGDRCDRMLLRAQPFRRDLVG